MGGTDPDGVQHFFDESELPTTFQETRWHLTREVDPFGNSIRYFWSPIFEDGTPGNRIVDVTLDRIEYASNEAAGLGPYAKIEFQYFPEIESCFGSKIPFGAAHQNNLGKAMKGYLEGSRRLTKISVFVSDFPESGWRLSREVTLRYNLDTPGPLEGKCDLMLRGLLLDTRFRYLREIRETGFDFGGTPTTLPPIEFRYGRTERENNLNFKHTLQREFDHVGTKEGALASLQDINDDGINDRVQVDVNAPICTLRWQRGHFGGTLGNSKELLEQFGELNHCTLNGGFRVEQLSPQETKEEQISFHFQVFGRAAAPVRHEKRFGWRPPHALEVADPQAHRRDLAATGPAGQRGATSARGVEPSRRGH